MFKIPFVEKEIIVDNVRDSNWYLLAFSEVAPSGESTFLLLPELLSELPLKLGYPPYGQKAVAPPLPIRLHRQLHYGFKKKIKKRERNERWMRRQLHYGLRKNKEKREKREVVKEEEEERGREEEGRGREGGGGKRKEGRREGRVEGKVQTQHHTLKLTPLTAVTSFSCSMLCSWITPAVFCFLLSIVIQKRLM